MDWRDAYKNHYAITENFHRVDRNELSKIDNSIGMLVSVRWSVIIMARRCAHVSFAFQFSRHGFSVLDFVLFAASSRLTLHVSRHSVRNTEREVQKHRAMN